MMTKGQQLNLRIEHNRDGKIGKKRIVKEK